MNFSSKRGSRVMPHILAISYVCRLAAEDGGKAPALRLNDVHSRLNPTQVAEVVQPHTVEDVAAAVKRAKVEGKNISISGARHSMGGQQFASGALHLDMRGLNRFIAL